jgi:hypothetical protein
MCFSGKCSNEQHLGDCKGGACICNTEANSFIIDTCTADKNNLIRRLKALKSTISCEDGGVYHEDKSFSQVWLETNWNEDDVERWLYETKGINYIGVCKK